LEQQNLDNSKIRSACTFSEFSLTQNGQDWPTQKIISDLASKIGIERFSIKPLEACIYGPGDYSYWHRDHIADENTMATLVWIAPTVFEGGLLEIDNGKKYKGGKLVIFLNHMLHRVTEVTQGYRLAFSWVISIEAVSPKNSQIDDFKELLLPFREILLDQWSGKNICNVGIPLRQEAAPEMIQKINRDPSLLIKRWDKKMYSLIKAFNPTTLKIINIRKVCMDDPYGQCCKDISFEAISEEFFSGQDCRNCKTVAEEKFT
jgi:hypothetical protein